MLDTRTLAVSGEQIVSLDDQELAAVVGGENPIEWLAKKIGGVLFDCLSGNLDSVISAAREGYADAR